MDFVLLSTSHLNLVDSTVDPRKTGDHALSRKEYYREQVALPSVAGEGRHAFL